MLLFAACVRVREALSTGSSLESRKVRNYKYDGVV
jgi:hypothetical protein